LSIPQAYLRRLKRHKGVIGFSGQNANFLPTILKKQPKGSIEFLCRAQNCPKNSAIPRRNSKSKKNLKVLPNPTKSKGEPLKNHRPPHTPSPPAQEDQRNCCGVGNNPEDLIDGRMKTVGAV
jgi:hypothetical protein